MRAARLSLALVAVAGAPALEEQGEWTEAAPMGDPRQELGVAEAAGIVYTVGGLRDNRGVADTLEAYDPAKNAWSLLSPLPMAVHHPAVASLGGKIYVMGGYSNLRFQPTARSFAYDIAADAWAELPPLPTARGAASAVALGGKVFVLGGNPSSQAVEAYDPATGEWEAHPPMPTGRDHLAAVALGGRLLAAGGRGGGDFTRANLEEYDPAARQWRTLTPMPTGRSGIAGAVVGGCFLVFGGEGNNAHELGVFPEVEAFDPAEGGWISLAPMALARHGIGAAVVGGLVYIPGGGMRLGFGTTGHHDLYQPPEGLACGSPPARAAVPAAES